MLGERMIWTGRAPANLTRSKRTIKTIFFLSDAFTALLVILMAWSTWNEDSAVVGYFMDTVQAPHIYVRAYALIQLALGVSNLITLYFSQERSAMASILFALPIPLHIAMTILFNVARGSWVALAIYSWGFSLMYLMIQLREPYDRVIR